MHLRVGPSGVGSNFSPSTKEFGRTLSDIVRCATCGHMQLETMPPNYLLGEIYEHAQSAEYVQEESGQRITADRVLRVVERHAGVGRLLDLGCWVGFLPAQAAARGWRATGVEPSAWACAYAREQLGLDVRQADLFEAELPQGEFEAVVMADVLEHLPDPMASLRRVEPLLRPGGVLVLLLPDAGSLIARVLGRRWWSIIPTHVQYFTRGSLQALLRSEGWHVEAMRTAPKAFTVTYYLDRLGGYAPGAGRLLVQLARAGRVADRVWAPDFRDRMLVVARRPDRTASA